MKGGTAGLPTSNGDVGVALRPCTSPVWGGGGRVQNAVYRLLMSTVQTMTGSIID